ncbi:hypothetical protein JCM15519_26700 [Fundidesulfovibrio butyratiphilus]
MKRALPVALAVVLVVLVASAQAAPVPFKTLLDVITLKLPGWEPGEPQGQTITQPFEASVATREFTKGDLVIEVAIYDGGPQYAAAITAINHSNIQTSEQSVKSLTIKGYKAVLSVGFKEEVADLLIAVNDRFVVGLNLTGSVDVELLKSAAEQLDLAKLAAMAK